MLHCFALRHLLILFTIIIIKSCFCYICPINCKCQSNTTGECEVLVQSSVCLLKWTRLSIDISDWNLVSDRTFSMCRSLKYLSISGQIRYLPADAIKIPSKYISEILIQNTQITNIANKSLQHFSHVENVIITSNRFLTKLYRHSLFNLKKVTLLDFGYNAIEDVSDSFNADMEGLRILKLNNNRLKMIGKDNFINLRQLRILELQHNCLVIIEPFGFRGLQSVTNLKLNNNFLDSLSHLELAEMPYLSHLDLSRNQIDQFILTSCTHHLKYVNLAYNNLTSPPIIELQRCVSLKKVSIRNNYVAECTGKTKKTIYDLNLCEKSEKIVAFAERPSYLRVYIILIIFALCIFVASFFVPFCIYRKHKNTDSNCDENANKSLSFNFSLKRENKHNVDNTGEIFL